MRRLGYLHRLRVSEPDLSGDADYEIIHPPFCPSVAEYEVVNGEKRPYRRYTCEIMEVIYREGFYAALEVETDENDEIINLPPGPYTLSAYATLQFTPPLLMVGTIRPWLRSPLRGRP